MNDGVWDKVLDTVKEDIKYLSLGNGIKVFKIIEVSRKTNIKNNDYSRATEEYCKALGKEKGNIERYHMREIKIKILHWDEQPYEGMEVDTVMSEKVFRRIVLTRYKIKQEGIVPPEYIIFWKKNKFTIEYAFISKNEFDRIERFINKDNLTRLQEEVYWTGAKVKFDKKKFIRYYKRLQE